MHRRVLFVLKLRHEYGGYGWGGEKPGQPLSSGLYNSARLVAEMLEDAGIPTKLVHVRDGNDIHREVVAFNATDVVIEAFWCPPYKFDDMKKAVPKVRFIVRNHSDMPFLAGEGIAVEWSFAYLTKSNVVLAPNSLKMLHDMRALARLRHPEWSHSELERRIPYLPNYYPVDDCDAPILDDEAHIEVGCFGAIRPLKNQLSQAVAAIMFADRIKRRLRFNINGQRIEMNGGPIRKSLDALFDGQPNAELICHDWLDHEAFKSLIANMDVVSCVSFSETFCIVAADAASQSVPLVTSEQIPWASASSRADPNSTEDIADKMFHAWTRRWATRFFDPNREGLKHYSARSKRIWLNYLRNP